MPFDLFMSDHSSQFYKKTNQTWTKKGSIVNLNIQRSKERAINLGNSSVFIG